MHSINEIANVDVPVVFLSWHHTAGDHCKHTVLSEATDECYCGHVNPLKGEINHVNNNFLIPSEGRQRETEKQLSNSQSWNADHVFLMSSW